MDDIAVLVAKNLYFDVLGVFNEFFEKNGVVSKSRARFAFRFVEFTGQVFVAAHHAHPASAPARCGFDDQRIADAPGFAQGNLLVNEWFFAAFDQRRADFFSQYFGGHLVAQLFHHFRRRTNERNAFFPATARKSDIFA